MIPFAAELEQRLDTIRRDGLYRELRRVDSPQSTRIEIAGRALLNFSSNDYLGLANHPALKDAAAAAIARFGAGAGASRLVCGSLAPHHALEESLAAFKGTEAALTFSSGYATAVGTICALVGKEDVIAIDKLVHACIVDAARLSGARIRVFAHNNVRQLEEVLTWAAARQSASRVLIATESVFSMDGDHAPLREIVELKDRYGAWLMVDEAHATGLFGEHRRGLAEELGVADRVEVQMGTLGKALGSAGGFVSGRRALVDYLVNRARTFIFSTAPVPAAAGAALAALQIVQSPEGEDRCRALREHVAAFHQATGLLASPGFSAIVPVILGDERRACEAADRLRTRGIFVPAIRYPTVARGKARLRISITAAHTTVDLSRLAAELGTLQHTNS